MQERGPGVVLPANGLCSSRGPSGGRKHQTPGINARACIPWDVSLNDLETWSCILHPRLFWAEGMRMDVVQKHWWGKSAYNSPSPSGIILGVMTGQVAQPIRK